MIRIMLADDRTEVDLGILAKAFTISIDDLEQRMRLGTITSWFEVGEGDSDNKSQMVFFSADLGVRVTLDEIGNVLTRTNGNLETPPLSSPLTQSGADEAATFGRVGNIEDLAPDRPDARAIPAAQSQRSGG